MNNEETRELAIDQLIEERRMHENRMQRIQDLVEIIKESDEYADYVARYTIGVYEGFSASGCFIGAMLTRSVWEAATRRKQELEDTWDAFSGYPNRDVEREVIQLERSLLY